MKLKRVWLPVSEWEEIRYNMWGTVEDRRTALDVAFRVTGNHTEYGALMMRVIREWPVSCENSLTDYSINRNAWVGHAAMALGYQIPEDIVRSAWGELTDEQRQLANAEAKNAIEAWEFDYRKNRGLHQGMGAQVLLFRHSG